MMAKFITADGLERTESIPCDLNQGRPPIRVRRACRIEYLPMPLVNEANARTSFMTREYEFQGFDGDNTALYREVTHYGR